MAAYGCEACRSPKAPPARHRWARTVPSGVLRNRVFIVAVPHSGAFENRNEAHKTMREQEGYKHALRAGAA